MWKNNVCSIMEEISLCVTVHGHIKGRPNNCSTVCPNQLGHRNGAVVSLF